MTEAIEVLGLRAGDTLIVRMARPISRQDAQAVKDAIRGQLTVDAPIVVVGPDVMMFEILRPEQHPSP